MHEQSILLSAGSNSSGQLGLGHVTDVDSLQVCQCEQGTFPPKGFHVVQLSSGANHTVALLKETGSDHKEEILQVWACGTGKEGQLGKQEQDRYSFEKLDLSLDAVLSTNTSRSSQENGDTAHVWKPTQVACGWNSTFVVCSCQSDARQSDAIVVLGTENDFGQLGVGHTKMLETGIGQVKLRHEGVTKIRDIVCGLRHVIALCEVVNKEGGQSKLMLYGWGAARHGQLDAERTNTPPSVYWEPHLIDQWVETKEVKSTRERLGAGKEHSMYFDGQGHLKIIGSDRQGQRQIGNIERTSVLSAACTWTATLVHLQGDAAQTEAIVGSGNNRKGQLGSSEEGNNVGHIRANLSEVFEQRDQGSEMKIVSMQCGSEHTLVLVKESTSDRRCVWGWGWNEHGNLAQGDTNDRKEPVRVWPPTSSPVITKAGMTAEYQPTHVWAGCGTTFVQLTAKAQL
jgi:alpha-tubulin suppressor-like RCC1 family protein